MGGQKRRFADAADPHLPAGSAAAGDASSPLLRRPPANRKGAFAGRKRRRCRTETQPCARSLVSLVLSRNSEGVRPVFFLKTREK